MDDIYIVAFQAFCRLFLHLLSHTLIRCILLLEMPTSYSIQKVSAVTFVFPPHWGLFLFYILDFVIPLHADPHLAFSDRLVSNSAQ